MVFDSSLCYRDMATLSFMLTVADTYLYPVLVLGSGRAAATDKRLRPTNIGTSFTHKVNVNFHKRQYFSFLWVGICANRGF